MTTKRERQAEFEKHYNALGFNDYLCGHEAIVTITPNDKIMVKVRKQKSVDESRNYTLTFDTQTQLERLFPAIMKGLSS